MDGSRISGDPLTHNERSHNLAKVRIVGSNAVFRSKVSGRRVHRGSPLLAKSLFERRLVEEHPRIDWTAVEPGSRGSLWILRLVESLSSQHPIRIPASSHARGEGRISQSYFCTQAQ